jgi:hypothetical protein
VATPAIPKPKDLCGINRKDVDIRVDTTAEKSFDAFGVATPSSEKNLSPEEGSQGKVGMATRCGQGVATPQKSTKPRPFLKDSYRNGDNDELYESLWQG